MHIRKARPDDFPQLGPVLVDMGFVEDEAALAERFSS